MMMVVMVVVVGAVIWFFDVCIDHITMRLAIVAANYELLATSVTFYDCTVHSSYVHLADLF